MVCLNRILNVPTPQSEPLDERQVPNSAGGHAYPVDDMTRLRRGTVAGTQRPTLGGPHRQPPPDVH